MGSAWKRGCTSVADTESDSRQDKLFFDDIISWKYLFKIWPLIAPHSHSREAAFDPDARRNYSLPSIRAEDTRLEKVL